MAAPTLQLRPSTMRAARVLFLLNLLALALIVLLPGEGHSGDSIVRAFSRWLAEWADLPPRKTFRVLEFAANIVLFIPFGFLLPAVIGSLRAWALWATVLLGFATTVCIETAQRHIVGRVSDPRDVLANTLGTIIGVLLVLIISRIRQSSRRRSSLRSSSLRLGERIAPPR